MTFYATTIIRRVITPLTARGIQRRVTCNVTSGAEKKQLTTQQGVLRAGLVEGKSVEDILLDTGCSRTLVHQSLVPESKLNLARREVQWPFRPWGHGALPIGRYHDGGEW